MSSFTLKDFVAQTAQKDDKKGFMELESERVLEANLGGANQMIWMKKGAMVGYDGDIKFTREGLFEHGIGKFFTRQLSGEGLQLTKAEGTGRLYMADTGKQIIILELQDESISVNGNDLLAFEPTVEHEITLMRSIAGMMSGGLFNVKLKGTGKVAITSHFKPLTLAVTADKPVYTDPNATIAWSGNLVPEIKVDVSLKSFFGRASGESLQMKFVGEGFVVVQPYEEIVMVRQS